MSRMTEAKPGQKKLKHNLPGRLASHIELCKVIGGVWSDIWCMLLYCFILIKPRLNIPFANFTPRI